MKLLLVIPYMVLLSTVAISVARHRKGLLLPAECPSWESVRRTLPVGVRRELNKDQGNDWPRQLPTKVNSGCVKCGDPTESRESDYCSYHHTVVHGREYNDNGRIHRSYALTNEPTPSNNRRCKNCDRLMIDKPHLCGPAKNKISDGRATWI